MRLFQPLKERSMALLWSGQLLSNIGDEIYNVALIWFAAGLIGYDTGFLSALQAAAIFLCSLFGGVWADRWDHRKTLICSDVIRGLVVLSLPIAAHFGHSSLVLLIGVALIVSGLNAFFTPALYALLPEVVRDESLLPPANGLLETTTRFARVLGPGLVGALGKVIPMIHFFTVDALSFFVSAASVKKIEPIPTAPQAVPPGPVLKTIWNNIKSGWDLLEGKPLIRFTLISRAIVTPAWYLVLPLGLALILHSEFPNRIGALGIVICGYGIGNASSNLVFGNFSYQRPERLLCAGRIIAGLGFVAISFSRTMPMLIATAALSAVGGPMTDIAVATLWQREYRRLNLARIYRLSLALTFGSLLICLGVSPFFFSAYGVPRTIRGGGFILFLIGVYGLIRFRRASSSSKNGS